MAYLHSKTIVRTDSTAAKILAVTAFAVGTAVCAQISFRLWFSPVPVTLQVFAVILSGLVLGSRLGALSQLQYLAMGAAGLPVFAEFKFGLVAFAGPTAGYLLGFVIAAYAAGWACERLSGRKAGAWCGSILSIMAIYLCGASWLAAWMSVASGKTIQMTTIWAAGVVPFIGVDILKAVAAAALTNGATKVFGTSKT